MPAPTWPDIVWLVRHGQSEGNVAHRRAEESGAATVDCDVGDMDMALTAAGETQSRDLGGWFGALSADTRPDAVVVSPYLRAQQTARHLLCAAGLSGLPITTDERIRDREESALDRLTDRGFRERYPDEAARAERIGQFWYRPPGGESWADVALRVRHLLRDVGDRPPGRRLLVVSHDLPIIVARYVIEGLAADQATALSGRIANCSVTTYAGSAGRLELLRFNDTSMLRGEPRSPAR